MNVRVEQILTRLDFECTHSIKYMDLASVCLLSSPRTNDWIVPLKVVVNGVLLVHAHEFAVVKSSVDNPIGSA